MKKWYCLLAALLLVGCSSTKFKIDKSRMEASKITLNYHVNETDDGHFRMIKPQIIDGDLENKIADFDVKIRSSKNVTTTPVLIGSHDIGIYQLHAAQKNDRQTRWIDLDPVKQSVTFSGEIELDYDACYLEFKEGDSLKADYDSLLSQLKELVDSVTEFEIGSC